MSPHRHDPAQIGDVLHRNIRALIDFRRELEKKAAASERTADAITRFTGSMPFVAIHLCVFGAWIVLNLSRVHLVPHWDPYPFVMLAMLASVEAIFLSTFVLISQNRMQRISERGAELDLQISLLAEHEVTRLIRMVEAIADRLGVDVAGSDLEELKQDVKPEKVLEELEQVHEDEAPH